MSARRPPSFWWGKRDTVVILLFVVVAKEVRYAVAVLVFFDLLKGSAAHTANKEKH